MQPDVEEEPVVSLVGGMAALQREGDRGGDEVDDHEAEEEDQQPVEVGGRGGEGMEVAVDEVIDDAGQEHEIDERGDQGEQHLEDEDVGQGEVTHGLVADKGGAMLPDGL